MTKTLLLIECYSTIDKVEITKHIPWGEGETSWAKEYTLTMMADRIQGTLDIPAVNKALEEKIEQIHKEADPKNVMQLYVAGNAPPAVFLHLGLLLQTHGAWAVTFVQQTFTNSSVRHEVESVQLFHLFRGHGDLSVKPILETAVHTNLWSKVTVFHVQSQTDAFFLEHTRSGPAPNCNNTPLLANSKAYKEHRDLTRNSPTIVEVKAVASHIFSVDQTRQLERELHDAVSKLKDGQKLVIVMRLPSFLAVTLGGVLNLQKFARGSEVLEFRRGEYIVGMTY